MKLGWSNKFSRLYLKFWQLFCNIKLIWSNFFYIELVLFLLDASVNSGLLPLLKIVFSLRFQLLENSVCGLHGGNQKE